MLEPMDFLLFNYTTQEWTILHEKVKKMLQASPVSVQTEVKQWPSCRCFTNHDDSEIFTHLHTTRQLMVCKILVLKKNYEGLLKGQHRCEISEILVSVSQNSYDVNRLFTGRNTDLSKIFVWIGSSLISLKEKVEGEIIATETRP